MNAPGVQDCRDSNKTAVEIQRISALFLRNAWISIVAVNRVSTIGNHYAFGMHEGYVCVCGEPISSGDC